MKFEIKNRWSGELIFSIETDSWKLAIAAAIGAEADLSEADLSWADLSEADLSEADLSEADLSWANLSKADLSKADLSEADLSEADLSWADLSWADLSWADLSEADLSWANLSEADLSKANLSWANLSWANLSEADLSKANLSWANLSFIRDDVWAVLSSSPREVEGLRQAIIDGKIDGSTYTGTCACLVGTIAHVAKVDYQKLPVLKANSNRVAERFFMGIKEGDKPETNPASKIALEWVDQWLANMKAAFAK